MTVHYRRSGPGDIPHMREFWAERWGDEFIAVHGMVYHPDEVAGFIATDNGQWAGLITYVFAKSGCEIVSLDSLLERQGIGSRLIEQVTQEAKRAGCKRVFLITTNDNLEALGFYQKRGFELVGVGR